MTGVVAVAGLGGVSWACYRIAQLSERQMKDYLELTNRFSTAMLDMAEKIKRPDAQFVEAIRAQAQPIIPEKDEVIKIDEDWLSNDDSLMPMADDLSPVFDADEEVG